jgi:hypothetical protein
MYGARLEQLSHLAHQRVTLPCAVMVAAAPYAIRAALRATSTILLIGLDLLYASNDTTRARRALVLEAGT